jgi:hypothetical protein
MIFRCRSMMRLASATRCSAWVRRWALSDIRQK